MSVLLACVIAKKCLVFVTWSWRRTQGMDMIIVTYLLLVRKCGPFPACTKRLAIACSLWHTAAVLEQGTFCWRTCSGKLENSGCAW